MERIEEDSIGLDGILRSSYAQVLWRPLESSGVFWHPLALSYFLLASSASSSLIRSACHLMMVSISCILRSCSAR